MDQVLINSALFIVIALLAGVLFYALVRLAVTAYFNAKREFIRDLVNRGENGYGKE